MNTTGSRWPSWLAAGACSLTVYYHAVLKEGVLFTHLFYTPVILAALWWKRRGIAVAVFLAVMRTGVGRLPEETPKATVLIVDDDPDVVDMLGLMLRTKGFDVLKAYRGIDGFNVARRELPDVVLLDVMMPDIDGYEVYRRLRLDPETRDIPVIFVSAKGQDEDVEKGLSYGAQGYIVKPFRAAVLMDRIKAVLTPEPPT